MTTLERRAPRAGSKGWPVFKTFALLIAMLASAPAVSSELTASDLLQSLGTDPGTDKGAAIAIVEATARIAGIEEANAFIDSLGERFPVHELREKLVAACADLSNFDCAYYEAARIEPFNWRMRAMSQIASAYAEQGNDERARATFAFTLEMTAREAPVTYRDQLIVGILRSVGEFGYLDIAEDSLAHVDGPERRADALFSLAHAAGRFNETTKAKEFYEQGRLVLGDVPGQIDPLLYARGAVAAAAAGLPHVSEPYLERSAEASDWAVGQIAALYHYRGFARETEAWKERVQSAQRQAWLESLLAETSMKAGRCEEALTLWHQVTAPSWAAASLLHMAEDNRRRPCLDGAIFVDKAQNAWLSLGSPEQITVGAQLAIAIKASTPPSGSLWTGRARWQCAPEPIIYPGWWDQASRGLEEPAGLDSTDGHRATAPTVVKLGTGGSTRYYLYYLAESAPWVTSILRAEISPNDMLHPSPRNVALEFGGPANPTESYSADYLRLGTYYGAVLPDLDADGEPTKAADGSFKPWFMYIATSGNNPGVAVSLDGGITFNLPLEPGINPIFPFEIFQKNGTWQRIPVEAESKIYDQSGSGSATALRTADGIIHMFYTARMWNYYTLDDLGATASEIFHRDGHIPDHGIGYAVSDDGLHWTRRTSMALGVHSPAAKGTGRIIDPRFRDGTPGELEYTITRPMVFVDGIDETSGETRYRMLVSSHSSTYRVRSLHSTDLINWTWDPSPSGGLFGLGAPGSFDDQSTAYGDCLRETTEDGDQYMCWYTGNRFGHYAAGKTGIGFCTMPVQGPGTGSAVRNKADDESSEIERAAHLTN